ncbi:MAG: hypothetical protein II992_03110 [Lachnospiraceae bacterium]|nr:hypothetical protein [Lachnospiraceae bacterium]
MGNGRKKVVLVALSLLCMIVFWGARFGIDDTFLVEAAGTKGIVTVSSLNVRTGPGTEYGLVLVDGENVFLYKNDEVKITDEENNFYKVKFTHNDETVTGYSCKSYIKLVFQDSDSEGNNEDDAQEPTPKPTQKPTKEPQSTGSDIIIIDGDTVPGATVKQETKTVKGLKIKAKVTASALRVRTKASVTSEQLTLEDEKISIPKGKKITILRQKVVNGVVWYYVRFAHEDLKLKGYVLSDYVTLTFEDTVKGKISSKINVNVRSTAGVSNDFLIVDDKIVSIKNNKSVKILKEAKANSKKWFKISFTYKGERRKGYILANLVLFKPDEQEEGVEATVAPSQSVEPTASPIPTQTVEPTTTLEPMESVEPTNTVEPAGSVEPTQTVEPSETPEITVTPSPTMVVEVMNGEGEVNQGPLNVRTGPGKEYDNVMYNGVPIKLQVGTKVNIRQKIIDDSTLWYYIVFDYEEVELSGFVMGQYITVTKTEGNGQSGVIG